MRLKTILFLLLVLSFPGTGPVPAGGQTPARQSSSPSASAPSQQPGLRKPDVRFVPTPPEVVDEMLRMAKVTKSDVVYDLGCGDGRIVITAAQKYGARGVGIDIDPERIQEAQQGARTAGVARLVKFRNEDLFEADIREATVVTLYLLDRLNEQLRPKLLRDLKPGTRIVSHAFRMGDWQPEQTADVDGKMVYLWTVPAKRAASK